MNKLWLNVVIVGLFFAWVGTASASVVLYDNGSYNDLSWIQSDPVRDTYITYDTFTLAQPATITGMQWWGLYYNNVPYTDDFTFSISTVGVGGKPGSLVASGSLTSLTRLDTTHTIVVLTNPDGSTVNSELYQYDAATSSGVTLPAGTTYFLSIVQNAALPNDFTSDQEWGWACSQTFNGPGSAWVYSTTAHVYDQTPNSMAFKLTGNVVPEPISMIFFGTGLVAVSGFVARRRMLRKA